MPTKVTLRISEGVQGGRHFVFDEPTVCILGRADDCSPQLPTDEAHKTVSRHHCLLDINPPAIRVRDFGSLNGTFVNGTKIGQRRKNMPPDRAAQMAFPEHDLKNGDSIRIGDTVFCVEVYEPPICFTCSAEIPEDRRVQAERLPGMIQCDACWNKAAAAHRRDLPKKKPRVCVNCGRGVAAEMGENRQGAYVCANCQQNPLQILKGMIDKAKAGVHELQTIRGYSIERELGRGGMGAVYLARHENSGELVALKVMLPRVAVDERARASFLRESENTKALRHKNIVEFRDSGSSDGTFFFTLEHCAKGSVDKFMERSGGKLPVKDAMAIICDVLDGLAYAHSAKVPHVKLRDGHYVEGHGLVHRDLSPHNILLAEVRGGTVAKVSDYGLGKAFDIAGLSGYTRTGSTAGKPWYMPRQQVINFKYAQPEVDVWAAAACLYEMLTGEPPRNFPTGRDVWQTVLETNAVPIRQRDARIRSRLAEVIDSALIDRPTISFKAAADLKAALLAAL